MTGGASDLRCRGYGTGGHAAQGFDGRPDRRSAVGVRPPHRVHMASHLLADRAPGRRRRAPGPGPAAGSRRRRVRRRSVRVGCACSPARWAIRGSIPLRSQREHQPLVAELALRPGDPLVVGEVLQIDLGARPRVGGRPASPRRRCRRADRALARPPGTRQRACCSSRARPPGRGRRGAPGRHCAPAPARGRTPQFGVVARAVR